jgi:hypothetical protein
MSDISFTTENFKSTARRLSALTTDFVSVEEKVIPRKSILEMEEKEEVDPLFESLPEHSKRKVSQMLDAKVKLILFITLKIQYI